MTKLEPGQTLKAGPRRFYCLTPDEWRAHAKLLAAAKAAFEESRARSETNRKWTTRDQRVHEQLREAIREDESQ